MRTRRLTRAPLATTGETRGTHKTRCLVSNACYNRATVAQGVLLRGVPGQTVCMTWRCVRPARVNGDGDDGGSNAGGEPGQTVCMTWGRARSGSEDRHARELS